MTAGPIKLIRNGIVAFIGDADPAPGGGSQPVACVLHASADVDLHSNNPGYLTWNSILDNLVDQNVLGALPAGIGIDPASVGTDTLTTTVAGIWAFTLANIGFSADATFLGQISFGNYASGGEPSLTVPVPTSGDGRVVTMAQTVNLPSGVGFSVGIASVETSTHDPYNVGGGTNLVIVRLA